MHRANLLLLTVLLILGGCRHAVLGKPAFIGASATAGFGAETRCEGEADALPVDLAVAYASVITVNHAPPIRCADALFYRAPTEAAAAQSRTVAEADPSIVFALDWLFWAAYAPISASNSVDASSATQHRSERVTRALSELDAMSQRRPPPTIVLGDLPDFARAPTSAARPVETLGTTEVAEINAVIRAWAVDRPWVVLVPVSAWPLDVTRAESAPLMQQDGLHPTAEGLVFAMQRICEALEARGLVQARDWRHDEPLDQSLLAAAAKASMNSGSAGWLDKASMYLAYRALNAELERTPPDCAAIERQVGRLIGPAPELDADPTGSGLGVTMAMTSVALSAQLCPNALGPLRRCLDQLSFDVRRARPNPFRLELWIDLSRCLGREEEVMERLGVLCRELGCEWGPYAQILESECRQFRGTSDADLRAAAQRRAGIVAMIGGPVATRDRGMKLLGERVDPVASADAVPLNTRGELPMAAEPPSSEQRNALFVRAVTIQKVVGLVLDLRAAASIGVDGAQESADQLLSAIVSQMGEDACQLAIDIDDELCKSRFLPNGGVVMRGYCDPVNRLQWGAFTSGGELSFSVRAGEVTAMSGAPPDSAELMAAKDAQVAVGLAGRFGAPDGVFTLIDGAWILTSVAADGTTATSRALDVKDRRVLTARARAPLGEARALPACDDLPALWRAIWDGAQESGCDVVFPFGVRVDGSFEAIVVRVEHGSPDPPTPTDANSAIEVLIGRRLPTASEPLLIEIPAARATLVGVVAPGSAARCVRPRTPMRLHAVWADAAGARHTGEVTSIRGGTDLTMAVTCAPSK